MVHIKTDSIKVPNATPELEEFIFAYGKEYGYDFEKEDVYEKFCLVNDAVYIAKNSNGKWTATGAQFAVPYVFKKLFSHEEIVFADLCETKSVTTSLHLDFTDMETPMVLEEGTMHFVGKVGQFTPVTKGGGRLVREKDGKYNSAPGSKGYLWLESSMVKTLGLEDYIDYSYYNKLVDEAIETISKYGDFEAFVG